MAGIEIPDEIIERYGENATRQEGEDCGIQIAREILDYTADFADGYYFRSRSTGYICWHISLTKI